MLEQFRDAGWQGRPCAEPRPEELEHGGGAGHRGPERGQRPHKPHDVTRGFTCAPLMQRPSPPVPAFAAPVDSSGSDVIPVSLTLGDAQLVFRDGVWTVQGPEGDAVPPPTVDTAELERLQKQLDELTGRVEASERERNLLQFRNRVLTELVRDSSPCERAPPPPVPSSMFPCSWRSHIWTVGSAMRTSPRSACVWRR